jgi:hypothetical protein
VPTSPGAWNFLVHRLVREGVFSRFSRIGELLGNRRKSGVFRHSYSRWMLLDLGEAARGRAVCRQKDGAPPRG